jgi:hypothetical protein
MSEPKEQKPEEQPTRRKPVPPKTVKRPDLTGLGDRITTKIVTHVDLF